MLRVQYTCYRVNVPVPMLLRRNCFPSSSLQRDSWTGLAQCEGNIGRQEIVFILWFTFLALNLPWCASSAMQYRQTRDCLYTMVYFFGFKPSLVRKLGNAISADKRLSLYYGLLFWL